MKSLSEWANRHQTLITAGVALATAVFTIFTTHLLNGPKFFPTSVVLTDAEERPVERVDLSDASQTCDAAVRSMLLAFAAEDTQDAGPSFAERASATAESPHAIIPEACRDRIDDGFIISANQVSAELKTARQVENRISISFVLRNESKHRRNFAFQRLDAADIKLSNGKVRGHILSGLHSCGVLCAEYEYNDATPVDGGRSVLIHMDVFIEGDEQPDTATFIVPIVRWTDRYSDREIVLAFNDVPIDRAAESSMVSERETTVD
jgi:hypothetical protein